MSQRREMINTIKNNVMIKKRSKIDNTDENSFAIGDTIYAAVTTNVDIDGMIFSIEVSFSCFSIK